MKKKLIALAVAGAFAAPVAAMADSGNVTIYGQVDASYDIVNNGTGAAGTAGTSNNKVSSNSSRIGFKGSEDLGDGLAAVWQLEQQINVDGTGAATPGQAASAVGFNTRNTFVGLSSKSMGTVVLGRHDTPYKLSTRAYDVFADSIADNRALMGQGASQTLGANTASFDGRQNDVVAYISPAFNGFTVAVAYVAGAETATTSGTTKGNAWSAMAVYGNGPFTAGLGYERHNIGDDANTGSLGLGAPYTTHDERAWKLGLGYTFGDLNVGVVYENINDNLAGGADSGGHNAWYVGGAYKMGNNAIKLAYATAGNRANVANTGAKQWALGVDHNFSKRTKVYALYTKLDNDNAVNYTLGFATSTAGGATAGVAAGADPSAWSFGIRHSF